jgi:hypothetical protein
MTKVFRIVALAFISQVAMAESPSENLFRQSMSFSGQSGISRPLLRTFQSLSNETKCAWPEKQTFLKWTSQPASDRRDFQLEAVCVVSKDDSESGRSEPFSIVVEGTASPEQNSAGFYKLLGLFSFKVKSW